MAGIKGRSGGARVGAGRKPISAPDRWLRGRPAATATVAAATGAVTVADVPMPDDLPEAVAKAWMALAPMALKELTLTETTGFAFQKLCEAIALEAELAESPMRRGSADHRGIMARVEIGMARFRLTGDGKPRVQAEEAKPLSALAQLQAQGASLRRVK